ncbi:MAG: hypothetical protein WC443_01295 [Desulfobaccales bacterium]
MKRKTWIIAVVLVVLGGALAGGLYWQWTNSPRYALQQMALALKARDMDQFFKYVELKELFNNFVDASGREAQGREDQDNQKTDDWDKMTRRLGRKFAQQFLPKLFASFEPQIRGIIEHYLLNLNNTQILGIAAAATVAQIDTQGDEALVTLTDPKTREKFRFQMRRQPDHGLWQIVSVNYDDLKRLCKREFQL